MSLTTKAKVSETGDLPSHNLVPQVPELKSLNAEDLRAWQTWWEKECLVLRRMDEKLRALAKSVEEITPTVPEVVTTTVTVTPEIPAPVTYTFKSPLHNSKTNVVTIDIANSNTTGALDKDDFVIFNRKISGDLTVGFLPVAIGENTIDDSIVRQSGTRLAINGSTAASAALAVNSTTGGVLLAPMTHEERNAIPNPAPGLRVEQIDHYAGLYRFSGTEWERELITTWSDLAIVNVKGLAVGTPLIKIASNCLVVWYQLMSGAVDNDPPNIIHPGDYDAGTNAVYWKLVTPSAYSPSSKMIYPYFVSFAEDDEARPQFDFGTPRTI